MKVTLDPKAWHARLQEFSFFDIDVEQTKSLCPYFWRTVAALMLVPLVFILRAVIWVLDGIGNFTRARRERIAEAKLTAEARALPLPRAYAMDRFIKEYDELHYANYSSARTASQWERYLKHPYQLPGAWVIGSTHRQLVEKWKELNTEWEDVFAAHAADFDAAYASEALAIVDEIEKAYRVSIGKREEKQASRPGLVRSYIKAVVSRVCPLIEWKSDR